ncbi:MAG: hypothetical protein IJH07_06840 [Ruminococcus sp.]|nr:hypothetical protein [Ruminococcus sp.]
MLKRLKNSASERVAGVNRLTTAAKIALLLMSLTAAGFCYCVFKGIFDYELHHAFTRDSPLYWTVGRGMLNGLKPYVDMYENKPLGVFLISALSFALTDDTIICNIVSIIAALMIAVIPALAVLDDRDRTDKSDSAVIRFAAIVISVLFMGLLITIYSEENSGGFQIEAIGAAFSILFIYLVKKQNSAATRLKRIILTAASALAISCAVMLKEPFLLAAVFGALLFVDNIKDFLRHIFLPCAAGGALVIIVLAAASMLVPYFSIYIKRMLETRLSGGASAYSWIRNIVYVITNLWENSGVLPVLLLLFFLLALLRAFVHRKNMICFAFQAVKIVVSIFVASFCVGVGEFYYNHHFVFAVPVYCAIVIYGGAFLFTVKPKGKHITRAALVLWTMVMLTVLVSPSPIYQDDDMTEELDELKARAQYVDSLLDFYEADRYQYVGFNENEEFFGLTDHFPQGPVFVQDPANFTSKNTWFYQSFCEQLNECDVIIVDYYAAPGTQQLVEDVVDAAFTEKPAKVFDASPPENFTCKIYYRTSRFG